MSVSELTPTSEREERMAALRQAGHHRRDALHLEEVDHARHQRHRVFGRARAREAGQRIDHHHVRLEGLHLVVHAHQVHLQAEERRPRRREPQLPGLLPLPETQPDRRHVADDLRLRFLEREIQAPPAPPARRIGERRRHDRLAGARRARDEHGAAGEVAAAIAEHRVQFRHAAGDARRRRGMIEPQRRDRQHRNARLADQERIFVRAVRRAAIFDDAQPARGDLLDDAVIEQDDAVGDELLEALTREMMLAALTGDDRRDAAVLQPSEQPPQFRAQNRLVRQAREDRLDRVEHEALRADRANGFVEADEEASRS